MRPRVTAAVDIRWIRPPSGSGLSPRLAGGL